MNPLVSLRWWGLTFLGYCTCELRCSALIFVHELASGVVFRLGEAVLVFSCCGLSVPVSACCMSVIAVPAFNAGQVFQVTPSPGV